MGDAHFNLDVEKQLELKRKGYLGTYGLELKEL